MTELMVLGGGVAAGYVLSALTWSRVRTFLTGTEQEITQLRARAATLEAGLRAAFGRNRNTGA